MRQRLLQLIARFEFLPPLLARLALGVVFVQSGWGKLHHLDDVTAYFESLHIPLAQVQAPFAAGTELVCGALLLVGLLTRLASVPLIVIMVVAIITAKADDISGVGDLFGLSETLLLLLAAWLAIDGAGKVSIDALLSSREVRQDLRGVNGVAQHVVS